LKRDDDAEDGGMEECPAEVAGQVLLFVCGLDRRHVSCLGSFGEDAKALRCASQALRRLVSERFAWLHTTSLERAAGLERSFPNLRVAHVLLGTPLDERARAQLSKQGEKNLFAEVSLRASPWVEPRNPLTHPLLGPRDASRSLTRLCALDVSGALSLGDATLTAALRGCPFLRELRCTHCPQLVAPQFDLATHLERLDVDACYRLDLDPLERFAAERSSVSVDVLRDSLRVHDVVEVVILSGRHAGRWVACSVVRVAPKRRYDVLVHPTDLYDHAVGFSGSCAYNVRRTHLRGPGKTFDDWASSVPAEAAEVKRLVALYSSSSSSSGGGGDGGGGGSARARRQRFLTAWPTGQAYASLNLNVWPIEPTAEQHDTSVQVQTTTSGDSLLTS